MWKSLNWVVISAKDDQSILIVTSSCNIQFFSELITTQLRDFHMVSPQAVFTLLNIKTNMYIFRRYFIKPQYISGAVIPQHLWSPIHTRAQFHRAPMQIILVSKYFY